MITPPAAYTPSAAGTHSVVLGAQIATRSPGSTPHAISARAEVVAPSASCANVIRSRSSTRASRSAYSRAARATTPGIVIGREVSDIVSYDTRDLGERAWPST